MKSSPRKTRICALLVFCQMLVLAGYASPLRIVALNIEWFPGQRTSARAAERARHLGETKLALERLAPDLLIATEICEEEALRAALADMPGLELHVISNFTGAEEDTVRRNQQIAIAARLPAVAGWAEPWEVTMDGMRRGFTFAALENPKTGHLILVYGLHLKSNRSNTPEEAEQNYRIRNDAMRQLIDHTRIMAERFADRGIEGWIIAGDINTNHDGIYGDRVVAMLEEEGYWNTWVHVPPEQRHTWKGREGRFAPSTLDYIFLKGFGKPDASLHEVDATVSDHNAVVVTIDLPEGPDTNR